jgi:hypothetical protein
LRDINYWKKKMYKYAIEIFYSEEEEGYLADERNGKINLKLRKERDERRRAYPGGLYRF